MSGKKKEKPSCCDVLEISKNTYAHEKTCEDFDGTNDAIKLREALKDVRLGWWIDQVLEAHPRRQILNMTDKGISDKNIWRDPAFVDLPEDHEWKEFENSLVVEYILPGVTLIIARGFTINPMDLERKMSAYCVQEIRSNNERKKPIKPRPRSDRS